MNQDNPRRWQEAFGRAAQDPRRGIGGEPPMPREEPSFDGPPDLDTAEYKPWVLQRGRSRPAMMLHLRRYEPKSGLWVGWQLAYPHLIAAEYIGDRMLSLDFGSRQFVIEGTGLDELARRLQDGEVLAVQEYDAEVWPVRQAGPIVAAIRRIEGNDARPPT
jgi:hypothetical protein